MVRGLGYSVMRVVWVWGQGFGFRVTWIEGYSLDVFQSRNTLIRQTLYTVLKDRAGDFGNVFCSQIQGPP